jgi:hypothetical protein
MLRGIKSPRRLSDMIGRKYVPQPGLATTSYVTLGIVI